MRHSMRWTALPAVVALVMGLAVWSGPGQPSCIPIEPEEPTCETLDPYGYGACARVLGVVFDGEGCVTASGCSCEPDCDAMFDSMEACEAACGLPDVLQVGDVCGYEIEAQCAEGLECCYPCGIQGCDFVCTVPCDENEIWCAGGCPMYP